MATITPEVRDQLEHWGDDRGASIVAAASILMIATTLFVVLRLWAQKLVKSKFDIDDYLIVGALASPSAFEMEAFNVSNITLASLSRALRNHDSM